MYEPCHRTSKIFKLGAVAQEDNHSVQSNKYFAKKGYTKQREWSSKLTDKDFRKNF